MIKKLDNHNQYDIIGDIHGHHDELVSLLKNLGYRLQNGIWKNGDRIPIFVGDYIDRGPKIMETILFACTTMIRIKNLLEKEAKVI